MSKTLMVLSILLIALPAAALVQFDQNVTPDVIFGSGNLNGSFTTDRSSGVELGLRGKLRFDPTNNDLPANVFNSDGTGHYDFQPGYPTNGFSWNTDHSDTPFWNFEFSVNTDYDDTSGWVLGDLTYELGLDSDPTAATAYFVFDPIHPVSPNTYFDHSMGDNSTTSATDVKGTAANYATSLATFIVAQNSWNYSFFTAGLPLFDPINVGTYSIYLAAFHNGVEVSRTEIHIDVSGPVSNEDATWSQVKNLYR